METVKVTQQGPSNPRGIPETIFIEQVEEFTKTHKIEKVMEALQEQYKYHLAAKDYKFKLIESQLTKSRDNMQAKVPEIEKALDIIKFLSQKHEKDLIVDFLLTDTIWSQAKVNKDVQKVSLWLGANVMVEFTYDEAKNVLEKNLQNALGNLKTYEDDINFLKDQMTTCEVNIARVYNQSVKLQQQAQQQKK